jgi:hypothetical protein
MDDVESFLQVRNDSYMHTKGRRHPINCPVMGCFEALCSNAPQVAAVLA